MRFYSRGFGYLAIEFGDRRASSAEIPVAMLEKKLSVSTVNVRFSAIRNLIGEAQRNDMGTPHETEIYAR